MSETKRRLRKRARYGWAYVATDMADPGWVKIGRTAHDDPHDRFRHAPYCLPSYRRALRMDYAFRSDDHSRLEAWLHEAFRDHRIAGIYSDGGGWSSELFEVSADAVAREAMVLEGVEEMWRAFDPWWAVYRWTEPDDWRFSEWRRMTRLQPASAEASKHAEHTEAA